MITEVLKLLQSKVPSKDKIRMIAGLIQIAPQMSAILTLAMHHNKSVAEIQEYYENFIIIKTDSTQWSDDVASIYNLINAGKYKEGTKALITEATFRTIAVILSPAANGLSVNQINMLLRKARMTVQEAHKILELDWNPSVNTNKPCGVCGRVMASTSDEGVCSSCKDVLKNFTNYRRGSFDVKINKFNFPKLKYLNDLPAYHSFIDYGITKEHDIMKFKHIKEYDIGGKLQLPLPFLEFATRIVHI